MNANARGHYTNNRNMDDMSNYQEDRIEALKRRIAELEIENAELRKHIALPENIRHIYGPPIMSHVKRKLNYGTITPEPKTEFG